MKGDLHRGYDFFTIKADQSVEMHCRVCGSKCEVSRGVEGAVSMANSLGGMKVKHDHFSFPHY